MRSEIQRKMIHLSSISIPITYIWVDRVPMLWVFVSLSVVGLVVEYMRIRVPAVRSFINGLFGSMLRTHEQTSGRARISGATYVIMSAALCIFIFPRVITIAGFAVLIISDTAGALFGRRFGRHRFFEKSMEGSAAFFVTAMMVVFAVAFIFKAPAVFVAVGALAACVATVVEAMSNGSSIDDNLTIPISFGLVMWGVLALVGGADVTTLLAR